MKLTKEQQTRLLMMLENENEHTLLANLLQQQAAKPKAKQQKATQQAKKPQRKLSKAEKEGFAIFWFSLIAFCVAYYFLKM